MTDEAVVYYDDLRSEFRIIYSRTHVKRLEKLGRFPPRVKPGGTRGSRFWWPRRMIQDYVRGQWKPDRQLPKGS